MANAGEIAELAERQKTAFIGLQLAIPYLLHPQAPLIDFLDRELGLPPETPVEIKREDGSVHSDEEIGVLVQRFVELPGGGLGGELAYLVAMHGAITLGDELIQAGQPDPSNPLLQFGRHLRNACAHGNRWHFRSGEPRHRAELRGRRLVASLHGTKAMYGWLGPGDYLDYLDDLIAELRGHAT
jgi:hypothetical protein